MKNEKYYKDTFDEIHVSEDVLEKLKDIKMEKITKKPRNTFRYAGAVMAVLAVCLLVASGISYAGADDGGNTWYGRIIAYVNGERVKIRPELRIHKNGSEQWVSIKSNFDDYEELDYPFVEWKVTGGTQTDGSSVIRFVAEEENDEKTDRSYCEIETDEDSNVHIFSEEKKDEEIYSSYCDIETNDKIADLIREEDKMYLIIGDNMKKIDVTEDIEDGECSGTFDIAGEIYYYEAVGNQWVYDIIIK